MISKQENLILDILQKSECGMTLEDLFARLQMNPMMAMTSIQDLIRQKMVVSNNGVFSVKQKV